MVVMYTVSKNLAPFFVFTIDRFQWYLVGIYLTLAVWLAILATAWLLIYFALYKTSTYLLVENFAYSLVWYVIFAISVAKIDFIGFLA